MLTKGLVMRKKNLVLRILLVLFILAALVVPIVTDNQEVEAAGGSKQLIIGGRNDALSNVETEYNSISGGGTWYTVNTENTQVISTAGTFSNLSVELSGVPGSNAYTFTLMINGNPTALTCDVAADETTSTDTTHTVDVSAGDYVYLRSSYSISPDNTPTAKWSIQFESDTANESLLLSCSAGLSTSNIFAPLMGGLNSGETTESNVYQIIPTNGKIKNFYIRSNGVTPGAGKNYTYTLRVNGVDTALVNVLADDNTTSNDTVHEISVNAGDYVSISVVPSGSPSNNLKAAMGMTFVSSIEGEFLILGQSSDTPTNNRTEYNHLTTTSRANLWNSTEANVFQGGQAITDFVLKKFYVKQSAVSGAEKSWAYTIRGGGGSTDLSVAIAGDSDTTGNDTTHTYAPMAYDDLAIMAVPSGNPTAAKVYWGLVGYIPGVLAPTLTTDAATNIAMTKATLNGTITDTGGENPTVRGFEWGTSTGVYTEDWHENGSFSAEAFTTDITGLSYSTTYYYRSYATNTAGTGYGSEVSFTTLPRDAGTNLIDTALPILIALAIIISAIGIILKNPIALLTGCVIGIIVFYLVQAVLNTL